MWSRAFVAATIVIAAGALGLWLRTPRVIAPNGPGIGTALVATTDAAVPERPVPTSTIPEVDPLSEALCSSSMAWVSGDYCVAGFDGPQGCRVPQARVEVCVDRHEYPNQQGVLPAVMATLPEARDTCEAEGKRLCSESEWTLACRGTAALTGCHFGTRTPRVQNERLWQPSETSRELGRVDGRRPSSRSGCVSAHGVFDLPGNVEEWTTAETTKGYEAALKGGHFNNGSIGCERSVYTRQLFVRSHQRGFRCCADPLVEPPAPADARSGHF